MMTEKGYFSKTKHCIIVSQTVRSWEIPGRPGPCSVHSYSAPVLHTENVGVDRETWRPGNSADADINAGMTGSQRSIQCKLQQHELSDRLGCCAGWLGLGLQTGLASSAPAESAQHLRHSVRGQLCVPLQVQGNKMFSELFNLSR